MRLPRVGTMRPIDSEAEANLPGLSPSQSRARRSLPRRPTRDLGIGDKGGLVADGQDEGSRHRWVVAALLPVTPAQAKKAAIRHCLQLSEVRVQALDVYCVDCRLSIADASESPCAAQASYSSGARDHLTGGPLHERARRHQDRESDRAVIADRKARRAQRSRQRERERRQRLPAPEVVTSHA